MPTSCADTKSFHSIYLSKMLKLALCVLVIGESTVQNLAYASGHGHGHHVIIHVPYEIKTIHHTHTITKHVHHKDHGDKYEPLGYSVAHPMDLSDHGHDHGVDVGNSAGLHDGHHLQGSDNFSGTQEFSNADWAGSTNDGIEDSGYEGSFENGVINSHGYHGTRHPGFHAAAFSSSVPAKHEHSFIHP